MKDLGGDTDGALQLQLLTLGASHQIAADCSYIPPPRITCQFERTPMPQEQRKWNTFLEVLDVPGGEGDADPVLLQHAPLVPRLAGLHRRRVRHVRRRHRSREEREEWGGARRGGRALGFRLEEAGEEVAAESARFRGARGVRVYVEAGGAGENRVAVGCGREEIWPLDRSLFDRSWCVSMTVGPSLSIGPGPATLLEALIERVQT